MLFKNKATGALKQINVSLDYAFAEGICKRLETVNKHVKEGTYPDRIDDRSICKFCDFRHICLPDEVTESIQIENNAEITELLDERERIKPMAERYEEVDEKVKEIFKPQPVGTYLVDGRYQVKISVYKRVFFNVPPDVKSKYKEEIETSKTLITALK